MRLQNIPTQTITFNEAKSLFLQAKRAQGLRERTLNDYKKELDRFEKMMRPSFDSLQTDVLKYFSAIPNTSPAIFNRPFGCLNAFFNWCCVQQYISRNPFTVLGLHKRRDDGNILPANIDDIKKLL